jgi:hypothetical protein
VSVVSVEPVGRGTAASLPSIPCPTDLLIAGVVHPAVAPRAVTCVTPVSWRTDGVYLVSLPVKSDGLASEGQ